MSESTVHPEGGKAEGGVIKSLSGFIPRCLHRKSEN